MRPLCRILLADIRRFHVGMTHCVYYVKQNIYW